MKIVLAVLIALSARAFADDFDGTWKVPDDQKLDPARCKKGDATECLHLAFTAEAGVRDVGQNDVERLAAAVAWHKLACTAANKPTCDNADRVAAQIAAAKALKTNDEKKRFWCGTTLDGAERFANHSVAAATIVTNACKGLFPIRFRFAIESVASQGGDKRVSSLWSSAIKELCPQLKPQPAECAGGANRPADQGRAASVIMIRAALPAPLAARADELVGWLVAH